MTKGFAGVLALCAACTLLGADALAAKKPKPDPAPAAAAPRTGVDSLPQTVVDEMTRYTSPGPQHQWLSGFAGTWTTRTRVLENPEAKPVEFSGGAEYRMILGGRFLELESHAEVNGNESHGLGFYGYDSFKEKYSFYFIHDGETQALTGLGDRDSTGATVTFAVAMDMPMAGEHAKPIRAVLRRVSGNRHVFEMYEKYVDDREWKVLEITYQRH